MTDSTPQDNAGIRLFPPAVFILPLAAGLAVHVWILPVRILPTWLATPLGAVLLLGWAAVMADAARALRRAGTPVNPTKPTTALVTTGPYALSRNPLYLSLTVAYLGAVALANALWPLVLLPFALFVIRTRVIAKEEAYLERKFGDAYRAYRARVRRWI